MGFRLTSSLKFVGAGIAVIGVLWGLNIRAQAAENYPTKPIKMLVGYAPGGSTDICMRILSKSVSDDIGQNVVIENKPGAGSSISIAQLIQAAPDGYTIASFSTGALINEYLRTDVTYDVTKDVTPIIMVAQYQAGLVVRENSPWKTVKELIAFAKTKPNALRYGTAGIGTQQHLTMLRLGEIVQAKWLHVPYKNGPEAIYALLRGDVDAIAQTAEWVPFVKDKRLRLLAVFTPTRMEEFPEAPTLIDLGYNLTAPSMLGIVGPKGIPQAAVAKLDEAYQKAMQTNGFHQCADKFGLKIDYKNTADFAKYIRETAEKWGPVIKSVAAH